MFKRTQSSSANARRAGGLSVLLAGVLMATAAQAAPGADASYQTYRRVMLGESTVGAERQDTSDVQADNYVPGPYAQYLVHIGQSKEQAIATARSRGEAPTVREEVHAQTPRTPFELYQRATGQWSGRSTS